MATTVLRFEKVKGIENVRQAGAHQHRLHADTPNADPSRKRLNRVIYGTNNLAQEVKGRLAVLEKEPRKNAVLMVEGIITLSPEMLVEEGGKENLDNLNKWYNHAKRWLKEEYGDNLVSAVLHRDESSPHIHFGVVPIIKNKSGKLGLSARDIFNKEGLQNFQKSYFAAMQKAFPELNPPKFGSKRKHTELKEFYASVDKIKDDLKIDAENMLKQLEIECRDSIKANVMPLIEKSIDNLAEKLEGRLTEEMRQQLKAEMLMSTGGIVEDAFQATDALKNAKTEIDRKVDSLKAEVKPRDEAPDFTSKQQTKPKRS